MTIEHGMYFALGFLAAALLAIAIAPAFWRRAVRLTKRRIEVATPVGLSEFRADKDRLRAEFAIALRNRDRRIDALRDRLAANVVALDGARTELAALRTERDDQFAAIKAHQLREEELGTRIRDLERDAVALAAQIRGAPEDYRAVDPNLMPDASEAVSAEQLSGDYRADVEDLLTALSIERQRNTYLEEQAQMLLARIEKKKKSAVKDDAIAMLRDTLAARSDPASEARVDLRKAEARISGAETRLNALLAETQTGHADTETAPASRRLLAEDFSYEEQEARIREQVEDLQNRTIADWGSEKFDAEALRGRLKAIAVEVSHLVYAQDGDDPKAATESLFERVSRFAADGTDISELAHAAQAGTAGPVSDRMNALRDRLEQQA